MSMDVLVFKKTGKVTTLLDSTTGGKSRTLLRREGSGRADAVETRMLMRVRGYMLRMTGILPA